MMKLVGLVGLRRFR